MSSRKKRKIFDLEKDWGPMNEDFAAIHEPQFHEPGDLNSYLDFLDELWKSERKEIRRTFYSEQFHL